MMAFTRAHVSDILRVVKREDSGVKGTEIRTRNITTWKRPDRSQPCKQKNWSHKQAGS